MSGLLWYGTTEQCAALCTDRVGPAPHRERLASILNATTPLFTVLVAHLLIADEKLTSLKAAGVVVGLAGAAVMIGPEALKGVETSVLAQLACLAAALSYAFAGIFGRRFQRMRLAPLTTRRVRSALPP